LAANELEKNLTRKAGFRWLEARGLKFDRGLFFPDSI